MKDLKISITLNQSQKEKFIEEYIRKELGETGEIKDTEIGIYLKSKLLKDIEKINFREKLDDIEKRIKNKTYTKKLFYLRDLYTEDEWKEMQSYKLLLGRLFFRRCLNPNYAKELGIKAPTDNDKDASGVQRYYKI